MAHGERIESFCILLKVDLAPKLGSKHFCELKQRIVASISKRLSLQSRSLNQVLLEVIGFGNNKLLNLLCCSRKFWQFCETERACTKSVPHLSIKTSTFNHEFMGCYIWMTARFLSPPMCSIFANYFVWNGFSLHCNVPSPLGLVHSQSFLLLHQKCSGMCSAKESGVWGVSNLPGSRYDCGRLWVPLEADVILFTFHKTDGLYCQSGCAFPFSLKTSVNCDLQVWFSFLWIFSVHLYNRSPGGASRCPNVAFSMVSCFPLCDYQYRQGNVVQPIPELWRRGRGKSVKLKSISCAPEWDVRNSWGPSQQSLADEGFRFNSQWPLCCTSNCSQKVGPILRNLSHWQLGKQQPQENLATSPQNSFTEGAIQFYLLLSFLALLCSLRVSLCSTNSNLATSPSIQQPLSRSLTADGYWLSSCEAGLLSLSPAIESHENLTKQFFARTKKCILAALAGFVLKCQLKDRELGSFAGCCDDFCIR